MSAQQSARPDLFPFEANLHYFDSVVRSAQQTLVVQIETALRSGDLQTAQGRQQQLRSIERTLAQLAATAQPLGQQMILEAWHQGADRAAQQIAKLPIDTVEMPGAFHGVSTEAVQAMQQSLTQALDSASQTLGRRVADVYAREQRNAALRAILGASGSPDQASKDLQQRLMRDKAVRRGVEDAGTGFVDSSGRRWKLDTYSNMATRTVTREAVVQGAVSRMVSHGIAIGRVSTHPGACEICVPFEGTLVALGPGAPAEYNGEAVSDTGEQPPFHPNCLVEGTQVCAEQVYGALRARYSGPVVDLTTASGIRLTVTPNHPVLTTGGWLTAGELREGDRVLRSLGRDGIAIKQHDLDHGPAAIEQVFQALDAEGSRPLTATARHDLHGDAAHVEGKVEVVLADRLLLDELAAALGKQVGEPLLKRADVQSLRLPGDGAALQLIERPLLATHGRMGGIRARRSDRHALRRQPLAHRALCHACLGRERSRGLPGAVAHSEALDVLDINGRAASHRLAGRPELYALIEQLGADARRARSVAAREVAQGRALGVQPDEIIAVDRRGYSGHVYDLSAASGMYVAAGLIISNCAHSIMPVAATIESIKAELLELEGVA